MDVDSFLLETTFLQGFVKARLAMFDKPTPKPSRKLVSGATTSVHSPEKTNNSNSSDFLIRQRELRTFKPSRTGGENAGAAKKEPQPPRTPELKLHKALP